MEKRIPRIGCRSREPPSQLAGRTGQRNSHCLNVFREANFAPSSVRACANWARSTAARSNSRFLRLSRSSRRMGDCKRPVCGIIGRGERMKNRAQGKGLLYCDSVNALQSFANSAHVAEKNGGAVRILARTLNAHNTAMTEYMAVNIASTCQR